LPLYNVFYTAAASRQFRRLPREIAFRVRDAIEALANNPRTFHTEKLESSPHAYRLRIGSYRVLYTVNDPAKQVAIFRIAHRREAYR